MIISIIIPVYNVEIYISRCLDSIYCQQSDEKLFEVIVVNDGTPDHSMSIVYDYAQKHENILIIEQENQGLSVARNVGLKAAKGDYVWFVDSDDCISPNSLSFLLPFFRNERTDVVGFGINIYKEGILLKSEIPFIKPKYKRYIELKVKGIEFGCIGALGIIQRYILRKDFLISNNLFFMKGVYHEDIEIIPKILCLTNSLVMKEELIYNYQQGNEGSITSCLSMKNVSSYCKIIESWCQFKKQYKHDNLQYKIISHHMFRRTCYLLSLQKKIADKQYKQFYNLNRWNYTFIGIESYIRSLSYSSLKDILRFLTLIVNPKWGYLFW